MLYLIYGTDLEHSLEQRLAVRPQHLERLRQLQDEGRLLIAGPLPAIEAEDPGPAGFTGTLVIADFDDRDAAESWVASDPYVTAGVFARVEVKPFRRLLP